MFALLEQQNSHVTLTHLQLTQQLVERGYTVLAGSRSSTDELKDTGAIVTEGQFSNMNLPMIVQQTSTPHTSTLTPV